MKWIAFWPEVSGKKIRRRSAEPPVSTFCRLFFFFRRQNVLTIQCDSKLAVLVVVVAVVKGTETITQKMETLMTGVQVQCTVSEININ